jgi:biotin-dependent carboxylase-like uncharacterized protein
MTDPEPPISAPSVVDAPASLRVESPGMMSTIQDLGRPGLMRFGVAPGGALDRAALILGNRLLGNDPGEAALEITLLGPELTVTDDALVAVTGADLGAHLNGAAMPAWQPVAVHDGDRLSFVPSPDGGAGVRAYLSVAGGFAIEPVLGSRATDLAGGFGGVAGRALIAGDEIPLRGHAAPAESILNRRLVHAPPAADADVTARVVLGPQSDRFTERGLTTLLSEPFTVSPRSNRTGIRLAGPAIEHVHGADLLSEGIAPGAVQVPGDGQPIVLLAARQTIGGYVKIATVIGADLDRFAQARPGAVVRFAAVTPEEARAASLTYWGAFDAGAVHDASPAILSPASDRQRGERTGNMSRDWNPDGVIRVIEAAKAAGVSALHIEVDGLTLDVRRTPAGDLVVSAPTASTASEPESLSGTETAPPIEPAEMTVTAPVLGVFYRRRKPEEPLLAEEGQPVEAGQIIGLLEVMKTYHEVTASDGGVLTAFLVDDGQFVEYGQALATIARLPRSLTAGEGAGAGG